jgi:hypothetical protein
MKLPKKVPVTDDDLIRIFTEIENNAMDKKDAVDKNDIITDKDNNVIIKIGKNKYKITATKV